MQTDFTPDQLALPQIAAANSILRKCVHCGFCTATCPTFVLLGDELDSPRGRIYLIKDMLETGKPPTAKVVKHIDRCLSCLACVTTCPASVDYQHLVDRGRARIEETFTRPLADRVVRRLLAMVLPRPGLFRLALVGAWLAKPLAGLLPARLGSMLGLAPKAIPGPSPVDRPQVFPAKGKRLKRVALMTGCAQQVLRPEINEATVRLLVRHGCEVVVARGAGCCGALVHHMGREAEALDQARANVQAWEKVAAEDGGLDAIVINASGCGTQVKDYGWMLAQDPEWAERGERVAALAKDVSEVMTDLGLAGAAEGEARPVVTYHSACSMQHGQQLTEEPKRLLRDAGFEVREPLESHLCCGSAGTYNMLQPVLAERLRDRKVENLANTGGEIVATGNIGCLVQLSGGFAGRAGDGAKPPVVHTVELLDWATGGPKPREIP